MEKYTLNCIKCQDKYESTDPDPYYCSPCNEIRKQIAKEVDAKIAAMGLKRVAKSELQIFDEIRKAKGVNFVNINDLGIKL